MARPLAILSRVRRPISPGQVLRSRPVRDIFWMTIGVLLTAWSLDTFLIPNKIAAGGVSGLATVVYYLMRDTLRVPPIPIGVQMLIMNVVLLAIGIRVRGWRYGAKTLVGAVGLSVAIDVMALPVFSPLVPHLAADNHLLAALWGGALGGIGLGLVFRVGGNTGGSDIVAQLLARKVPLGSGQLMLIIDFLVLVFAGLVLGADLALYGAVAVFVMGTAVDIVQEGLVTEKAAYVFSDQSEPIGEAILHELGRGATALHGRGLYSGKERDVIFTVVSRTELDDLKAIVNTLDPDAFVVISDVHEALGEGFREYRKR